MPRISTFSAPRKHRETNAVTPAQAARRKAPNPSLVAGAAAAVVLLLAGCGAPQASLSAATAPASKSATATPTATPIADTPCSTVNGQQVFAESTYVCTKHESGRLVWLEAAQSKRVTDKLAAAAAAKAAADKAAADKASAEEAARQAAAAKAAADKAAADAAAKAATPQAPVAQPVPGTNPGCDPNYSGCVPIASDVDCAGGSGNGPAYVRGPIQVTGRDIYGLDSDHDGIACEK
ncbi:hypothetical protein ACFFGR_12865 [Arthrobacter liuii]|uniref:Excalibur calcium-binding domain-containing protein n=1 Tax=Arthrobacter liuii TaxID=1476996 RepID=A0ABQ2AEP0_9MICC|nr:hypothetical protein [Arthrobacter liuii]GGH90316.1 hypothetical protein GCM10007170_03810 [Arthrobacter liuii]